MRGRNASAPWPANSQTDDCHPSPFSDSLGVTVRDTNSWTNIPLFFEKDLFFCPDIYNLEVIARDVEKWSFTAETQSLPTKEWQELRESISDWLHHSPWNSVPGSRRGKCPEGSTLSPENTDTRRCPRRMVSGWASPLPFQMCFNALFPLWDLKVLLFSHKQGFKERLTTVGTEASLTTRLFGVHCGKVEFLLFELFTLALYFRGRAASHAGLGEPKHHTQVETSDTEQNSNPYNPLIIPPKQSLLWHLHMVFLPLFVEL